MTKDLNPELHTFRSSEFKSVVDVAVTFFESTPEQSLPPSVRFPGAGVYALYYLGDFGLYESISILNKDELRQPIYVGKAVPAGSRTGIESQSKQSFDLLKRLNEHKRSLREATNLDENHFRSRFMIFGNLELDLIAPVESALIRKHRPLWNSNIMSGFGIHTPGKGRFGQRRSRWDVLHPGRSFALNMVELAANEEEICSDVKQFLSSSRKRFL